MAEYKFPEGTTVTITNNAEQVVNKQSYTGPRVEMTVAEAKAAGYTDFQFLLAKDGNFITTNDDAKSDDNVKVVVRTTTNNTDRYVQFFATQQRFKLAKGDSLQIEIRTAAEAAHYKSLEEIDGLSVVITEPEDPSEE